MKITFLLTPRLVVIMSACASTIVLLLLMLGFELGLRQAHEDYAAQAKARGEPVYSAGVASTAQHVDSPSNTQSHSAERRSGDDNHRGTP